MNTRNLLSILAATVIGMAASVNAANILWVTENASINTDWNNLLTGAGHTVTGYFDAGNLAPVKGDPSAVGAPYTVAELNAYDLIITAGSNDSSGIGDFDAVWETVTAPILAMGVYSLDAGTIPDWAWFASSVSGGSASTGSYSPDPIFGSIDPTLTPLFTDKPKMAANTGITGSVLARDPSNFIQIARWAAGSTGIGAGERMFFAGPDVSGSTERDYLQLTSEGQTVFLNAVNSLAPIPEPSTAILAGLGLAGMCLRRRRRK